MAAMWVTDVTFWFVHAPDGHGVHGNSDMSAAVSTRVFGVVRIATQVHQYPGISCEFGLVTFGCAQSTPPANIISTCQVVWLSRSYSYTRTTGPRSVCMRAAHTSDSENTECPT